MKTRYISAVFLFAFTMALGSYVAQFSWNGVIYLTESELRNDRNPAAIRRDLDFSLLNGTDLVAASQKRLVTAARTVIDKGEIGIQLGHFVTRSVEGKRQLACDVYDRLSLRFEAEGIAEAGEKPTMDIESSCVTAHGIAMIEAVWIPVQKIIGEHPSDMDVSFDEQEAHRSSFRFSHMPSEWPMQWRLQAVRLFDVNKDGPEVSISGRELRDLLKKPLVLNWNSVEPTK